MNSELTQLLWEGYLRRLQKLQENEDNFSLSPNLMDNLPLYPPTGEAKPVSAEKLHDIINQPNHYHKNEIDVNGYLEKHFPKEPNVTVADGFYIGNVIKYVSRHKEKNGLEDLEKAEYFLHKLMDNYK